MLQSSNTLEMRHLMFSPEQFAQLVQFDPKTPSTSSSYYWKIYQKFGDRSFIPQMNWVGFAFGSTLFLYRRMYLAFFLMLCVEQIIETYITTLGFDRGMAHAYGTFIGNAITAVLFNSLYLRFVRRKSEKQKHIGVHVRLFLPIMIFLCILFGSMVFQFVGLHWHIHWINFITNYIFLFGVVYMIILYVHYIRDWRAQRS